jgi:PKD repeat protein
VVTYNLPGVYDVTLTVTNSAGSNTVTKQDYIVVELPSGIGEQESNLRVFPNPASDRVHLHSDCSVESVSIHSVSGEEMLLVFPGTGKLSLPVYGLKEGVYILTILTERQVFHKKLEVIR